MGPAHKGTDMQGVAASKCTNLPCCFGCSLSPVDSPKENTKHPTACVNDINTFRSIHILTYAAPGICAIVSHGGAVCRNCPAGSVQAAAFASGLVGVARSAQESDQAARVPPENLGP